MTSRRARAKAVRADRDRVRRDRVRRDHEIYAWEELRERESAAGTDGADVSAS